MQLVGSNVRAEWLPFVRSRRLAAIVAWESVSFAPQTVDPPLVTLLEALDRSGVHSLVVAAAGDPVSDWHWHADLGRPATWLRRRAREIRILAIGNAVDPRTLTTLDRKVAVSDADISRWRISVASAVRAFLWWIVDVRSQASGHARAPSHPCADLAMGRGTRGASESS